MSGPNAADWAVFLQVRQKGLHSIFKGMSTKMAQSEERRPGHSEQGIWCTSWNGGQTEGTNHAHKSCTERKKWSRNGSRVEPF